MKFSKHTQFMRRKEFFPKKKLSIYDKFWKKKLLLVYFEYKFFYRIIELCILMILKIFKIFFDTLIFMRIPMSFIFNGCDLITSFINLKYNLK